MTLQDTKQDPVATFMASPLVQWVQLLLKRDAMEIDDLIEGVQLNDIMLQIDPRPKNAKAIKTSGNDVNVKLQNLTILIQHIKSYYEEVQKQVVVMSLPRLHFLLNNYKTAEGLAEMEKILLLVLGCAVQCEHRETFVEKMKQLTYEGMEVMMNHIKNITENANNVLNLQWDEINEISSEELKSMLQRMSAHVHNLVAERDKSILANNQLSLERDYLSVQTTDGSPKHRDGLNSPASKQHLIVELNEAKSRLRKTRQELDEKVEENTDFKQELKNLQNTMRELKQQNTDLMNDARGARTLRDENDILKDKAAKASRLEFETEMLKEKLKDIDFFRQRVEEIREDNRILHDTKNLLEEQLESTRTRLDGLVDAEKKIIEQKQQIHELTQEREKDKLSIQELMETNSNLQFDKMQSMNESGSLAYQLEQARENAGSDRKSILLESEESVHTKALRLEKENKHLQTIINSYKDTIKSTELSEASLAQMEKENRRLSNKVVQLQEVISKEKQSVLDFEQLSNDLTSERHRLEMIVKTTQDSANRRLEELDAENQQLSNTIASLRSRAQISDNAKLKAIEKENKVLSELVKDVSAKLHKSQYEQKQLDKKVVEMKDNVATAEAVEKENAKLEKQNLSLQKSVRQLEITCGNVATMEQNVADLDVENRQLKKKVKHLEELTEQLQVLEDDKSVTEQESNRLKRQVESLKKACKEMTRLEQDKLEAEKLAQRLQQTLDTRNASAKHSEKLELVQVELENELERLRSHLDATKRRLSSREEELQQMERKNDKMNTELEHFSSRMKRMEKVEKENLSLSEEASTLRSSHNKSSNEVAKLKKQLEIRDSEVEQVQVELEDATRRNKILASSENEREITTSQLMQAEADVKRMQKQQAIDKATLSELREELVCEKLNVKQKQTELERFKQELSGPGLSSDELKRIAADSDSGARFTALESRFESTFKESLESKEAKIRSLESRLQESANLNNKLRQDFKSLKHDYDSLLQRHQEEVTSLDPRSSKLRGSPTSEIFKIKDHLISVERKNATLIAENAALKSASQENSDRVKSLKSQVDKSQRQFDKSQDTNATLQREFAKLQVENSTLQSQCGSLMSQNAQSNSAQASAEAERVGAGRRLEEMRREREQLERDHEDMTVLHEQQTVELENLMQNQQKLKQQLRELRNDKKAAEERLESVIRQSSQDQHLRKSESANVSGNLDALKEAHDKLNKSYKTLNNEYEELQSSYSTIKSALNQTKLEYAKLEAESSDIRDHNQQLDLTATKLNSRCEVLMQLKVNLEEENRHLLEQISRLMSQNEELLSQTLESKDQIYSEQKQYTERMQEIRRQKEKLEEKIMDLYRTPGHSPSKRKGLGATLKKTWQNLKTSESRRKRDGLPSSPNLEGSFHNSSSLSTHSLPQESVEATSNERIQDGAKKDGMNDGRSEQQEKRRSRLGASLAYSTNALHSLSVSSPQAKNNGKPYAGSSTSFRSSLYRNDGNIKSSSDISLQGHVVDPLEQSSLGGSSEARSSPARNDVISAREADSPEAPKVLMRKAPHLRERPRSVHSDLGSPRAHTDIATNPRIKAHTDSVVTRTKTHTDVATNAAVQRLDSLVGSPRDPGKGVPPRANRRSRLAPSPFGGTSPYNRDLTSTPVSEDRRGIPLSPSPDVMGKPPQRRDVPPTPPTPHTQSPIRRDVPPDLESTLNKSDHLQQQRSPSGGAITPDEDSDKSTQWYEYGCV